MWAPVPLPEITWKLQAGRRQTRNHRPQLLGGTGGRDLPLLAVNNVLDVSGITLQTANASCG